VCHESELIWKSAHGFGGRGRNRPAGRGVWRILRPAGSFAPGSVTQTSTINGPTTTTTFTSTTATIVTVSEGAQQAKVSSVTVGGAPQGFAFNPTENTMYVALKNSSAVAVINAATNGVVTTIKLPVGSQPVALAYDSANNLVYVSELNATRVDVINSATNALSSPVAVEDTTNGVAVNPSTNTVYLASNDDDAMYFVDGGTSKVSILQVHGGMPDNAQALVVDQATKNVIVGNWYGKRTAAQLGFVSDVNPSACLATNTNSSYCVTKSMNLDGGQIDGVAVNQNTGMIYVANYKASQVNVVSEATGQVVANVTVPSPYGILADASSNLVYVASLGSNSLVVMSGSTNAVLGTIPVGSGPIGIGLDTNDNAIYVANQNDGTISIIDGTSLLF